MSKNHYDEDWFFFFDSEVAQCAMTRKEDFLKWSSEVSTYLRGEHHNSFEFETIMSDHWAIEVEALGAILTPN